VYAYGDSSGDTELLELFSEPTWVNDIDLVVLSA
jgi:phosphoserine phosphatase